MNNKMGILYHVPSVIIYFPITKREVFIIETHTLPTCVKGFKVWTVLVHNFPFNVFELAGPCGK
jgi:hypothetical protein